jgi:hypothetical protein
LVHRKGNEVGRLLDRCLLSVLLLLAVVVVLIVVLVRAAWLRLQLLLVSSPVLRLPQ